MSDVNNKKSLPKRSEAKFTECLTKEATNEVEKHGWSFFRSGIVLKSSLDRIILVKEAKVKITKPDGTTVWELSDDGKWNLPIGRLLPWWGIGNSASCVGSRKSLYDFDMHDICHIGFCSDIDDPYIAVIYRADQPYDLSLTDQFDPEEVVAADWFSYDDILRLNEIGMLSDPELVLTAVRNALNGFTAPAEIITHYASKYASDTDDDL